MLTQVLTYWFLLCSHSLLSSQLGYNKSSSSKLVVVNTVLSCNCGIGRSGLEIVEIVHFLLLLYNTILCHA